MVQFNFPMNNYDIIKTSKEICIDHHSEEDEGFLHFIRCHIHKKKSIMNMAHRTQNHFEITQEFKRILQTEGFPAADTFIRDEITPYQAKVETWCYVNLHSSSIDVLIQELCLFVTHF
jgi:hypothetical protein